MSFILDALKKSELERQRQALPGLVEAGGPRSRSRLPAWAVALGALLGINLLVLAFLLTRNTSPPAPPATAQPSRQAPAGSAGLDAPPSAAPPAQPLAAAPSSPAFSPMAAAPDYAPEIPVSGTALGTGAVAPADLESNRGGRGVHLQDPVLTQPQDYQPVDEEVLPTINEVSLTGAEALPELHLDVHVFATRAADRFVYVNMRKYHEGATLQEGPVIERIRRDGVVLRWQNLRFLLPRQ